MAFCKKCGTQIENGAAFCPNCGSPQESSTQTGYSVNNYYINNNQTNAISPKSRLVALLLCLFLGGLGIHRFYVGKVGTGILWLFTAGCFGIGCLVDLIMIACGSFRDISGLLVTDWNA